MDWKIFATVIIGLGLLVASFFIGGKVLQRERVLEQVLVDSTKVDTLYLPVDTIIVKQTHYIPIKVEAGIKMFRDTLKGLRRNIKYEITQETKIKGDSVENKLSLDFRPLMTQILTYHYREVQKPELVYIDVEIPFYLDSWFWSTLALLISGLALLIYA